MWRAFSLSALQEAQRLVDHPAAELRFAHQIPDAPRRLAVESVNLPPAGSPSRRSVRPAAAERCGVLASGSSGTSQRSSECHAARTGSGAVRTRPVPGINPGSRVMNRVRAWRRASSTVVVIESSLDVA